MAAVLIGLAVCVVSVQAACDKGCDCLTPAEAEKLHYISCGEKPQVCGDDLSKTEKYCFRKPVTPAPVPVKCDEGCSCLDPAKATAAGYLYCDTPHAVCNYDDNNNPLYCFKKPEPVTVPPVSCAEGCSCMTPEKASVAGYTFCNGKQVVCDKDTAGNLRYCYGKPVTEETTTVVPDKTVVSSTTMKPVACAKGCSCLDAAMINKTGYRYCGGTRTLCGYDPTTKRPLNCFEKIVTKEVGEESTTPATAAGKKVEVTVTASPTKTVNRGSFAGILDRILGRGCPGGETRCNGECVDLQTSASHCGACNAPCALNEVCEERECRGMRVMGIHCPQGWILCGDQCFNPLVNEQHCGDCDTACPEGYNCMVGRCANADGCPPGTELCGQDCIDILRSDNHCGDCITHCVGWHCINGVCDVIGQGGSDCRSDWLLCGLDCVNPITDPENCGECGNVCGPTKVCLNGRCTCSPDMTACLMPNPFGMGMSGVTACTHLQHDADNCGECGNACNSDQLCLDGRCTCMDGTEPCDRVCGLVPCDGDCVNFLRNPDHCGGCGNACEAGETCCNGDCVNILSDEENCGRCGATCSGQRNTCCDGDCTNIESRTHCGACNKDCGAAELCVDGPLGHSCCFALIPWWCRPPT